MDERLSKALDFANFKQTLYLEKRRLQERLKSNLVCNYNGGTFTADQSLIAFLNLQNTPSVILDNNLNPIQILDISVFRQIVIDTYTNAVTNYSIEIDALRKKRSVQAIAGL